MKTKSNPIPTCLLCATLLQAATSGAQPVNFMLSTNYTVGMNPPCVVVADVNGDGKKDLISTYSTNSLIVLTNNGSGIFGSNAVLGVGKYPNAVAAADINGDGNVDLICANGDKTLTVLTNNGNGVFGSNASYTVTGSPYSVIAADINGDGYVDLISGCYSFGNNMAMVSILTNNGSGGFGFNATFNLGSSPNNPEVALEAADLNGDGWPDLICAIPGSFKLMIYTNTGSGGLVYASSRFVNAYPDSVVAADVDGYSNIQLVCVNFAANTITVLTNNGNCIFNVAYAVGVGSWPYLVTAADINGDGKVDLITANVGASPNYVGTLTVLTNNGSGIFSSNANYTVGRGCQWVVPADVNGDGRLDLICANSGTNTLSVLTNTLTFLPSLSVKHSTNNVIVSWASSWTGWAGWTLQQNTDLNTTNWTGFSGTIGDDGITKSVTNSSPQGNLFFRLSHP
jgi:hypothetical protein